MLSGGCGCGRVRYTFPVDAVRFGFASCHCGVCRHAHGAPFVLWTGLARAAAAQFALTSDAPRSFAHRIATRHFCGACGTPTHLVYMEGGGSFAGEVHVATATIDETSVPALEARMQAIGRPRYLHVFYSDRGACLGDMAQWAAAPRYGGPSGTEPVTDG